MRIRKIIFTVLVLAGLILYVGMEAAVCAEMSYDVAGRIEERIRAADPSSGKSCLNGGLCVSALTRKFYTERKFQPAWSNSAGPLPQARELLEAIRESYREGLKPSDYSLSRLESSFAFVAANGQSGKMPDSERKRNCKNEKHAHLKVRTT